MIDKGQRQKFVKDIVVMLICIILALGFVYVIVYVKHIR